VGLGIALLRDINVVRRPFFFGTTCGCVRRLGTVIGRKGHGGRTIVLILGVLVVPGWLSASASATTACPSGAGTGSTAFTVAGEYTYAPPPGVQAVCVFAVGASGGSTEDVGFGPTFGGQGTAVSSWLNVPSSFFVEVGSRGGDGSSTVSGAPGVPYGGPSGGGAGGGGGETDLRTAALASAGSASTRMLVAGGGGGAGGQGADSDDSVGDDDAPGGFGGNSFETTGPGSLDTSAANGTTGGTTVAGTPGGGGGSGAFDNLAGGGGTDPDASGHDGGSGGGTAVGTGGGGGPYPTTVASMGMWGAGGGGGGGYAGGGGGSSGGRKNDGGFDTGGGGGGGGGSSFVDSSRFVGGDLPTYGDAIANPSGVTISWVDARTLGFAPQGGLSFSDQQVGVPGAPLTITVTNQAGAARAVGSATVGGEALHISAITLAGADPGDYTTAASGCASIAAQASCTITVTFTANGTGERPATLQLTSDDRAQTGPVAIPLTGTGTRRTSATSVKCPPGSTTVGATVTCTMTVNDVTSGSELTPTGSVSLSSDSAGAVANPGNCTLVPTGASGSASCSLTYKPSAVGGGHHKLTASYSGDMSHLSTAGSLALVVTPVGGGGPTAAQIKASLLSQLVPKGKTAKIDALRHAHNYKTKFRALLAGKLVVDWYYVPAGARVARPKAKPKPVLVAVGRLTFPAAGAAELTIMLTRVGKQRLEHASKLKLTAKASFARTGAAAVIAAKSFTLER
jgi:hypothetical protein